MMRDGTHILDGYAFGLEEHPVVILEGGYDPGSSEFRTNDIESQVADLTMFGRDLLTGPTIEFTLGIRNDVDVWPVVADLTKAWRADTVRRTPGALSALVFVRAGRTYRAWGRSRKFGLQPAPRADDEFQTAIATFKVAEPFIELDALNTVTCRLLEPVGDGGVVFPVVFPVEFRPSSQAREGSAVVGGIAPAHFTVTIKGPVTGQLSQARVYGPGWSISITRPLAYDETVVIDTRRQTVTLNGRSMPGLIGPRDRLDARLSPGSQVLGFEGSDPSGTATAAFSWRDTIPV